MSITLSTDALDILANARFMPSLRAAGASEPRAVQIWDGHTTFQIDMPNGSSVLVSVRTDRGYAMLEAVQVPNPKRGRALHVSGLTHWRKWKGWCGIGYKWAGRKGHKATECELQLVACAVNGRPLRHDSTEAEHARCRYAS